MICAQPSWGAVEGVCAFVIELQMKRIRRMTRIRRIDRGGEKEHYPFAA